MYVLDLCYFKIRPERVWRPGMVSACFSQEVRFFFPLVSAFVEVVGCGGGGGVNLGGTRLGEFGC